MSEKIAVTGIQASGQGVPTLGNYLGMYQPAIALQQDYQVYYFVADHHAISARIEPAQLRQNSLMAAAWYIACGLNPDKGALFIQSHVREHTELGWILNGFTYMGELERMTQFKDKSSRYPQNINAALFTYPVLQAADVLLYNAHVVPVGEDQKQHIELMRDVALRFNGIYGKTFQVPEPLIRQETARIRNLQVPEKKMSKSEDGLGTVFLLDDMATIDKKFKKAVTDSLGSVAWDEDNQVGVTNLLGILAACTGETPAATTQAWADKQYGPFKQAVADAVVAKIAPVQARYHELMNDKAELLRLLTQGADKARAMASPTLKNVMEKVGYVLG
ncbi:MAG: tryptophan--tRNA ligase [Alphaproteobacteria bacterium]